MDRTIVPNATLFPNFLSDEVMPLVDSDEWKIIHFGVVASLRVDRVDDGIGIPQFVQGTGLPEERVRECLGFLCDTAQVFLRHDRPRRPQSYRLNLELSAPQLQVLEARQKGIPAGLPRADRPDDGLPGLAEVAAPPRLAPDRHRGRAAEPFPERPSVELRLDSDEGPIGRRLRQALPPSERAAFEHLIRHYPRARGDGEDGEAWGLYRLWQTYGFACLNNALVGDQPASDLSEVNRNCLMDQVTKLYEQEIGQLTPGLHVELARLTGDYPAIVAWQDAFRLAVKLNKRRLSTVETILKNQKQKAMEEVQRPAPRVRRKAVPAVSTVAGVAAQDSLPEAEDN
jgi:hypothetical protein